MMKRTFLAPHSIGTSRITLLSLSSSSSHEDDDIDMLGTRDCVAMDYDDDHDQDNNKERQEAELDFVEAAYGSDEAWCEDSWKVFRRVSLPFGDASAHIILELHMPELYPTEDCLDVLGVVESASTPLAAKAAYDALPEFLNSCRQLARALKGDEAVLSVLQFADEWVSDEWPAIVSRLNHNGQGAHGDSSSSGTATVVPSPVFGRRLIYSHHIIAKRKRAELQALVSEHKLSGFVKIGWPGIIIIEGLEEDCQAFYDEIRRWSWQHLEVRGEMQEIMSPEKTVDEYRKFNYGVREEGDMSVVATACRDAGLEDLFKTSMKIYENTFQKSTNASQSDAAYGALIQVDHMNDGKSYRKWLRRTASEIDILLMIKQCHPNDDIRNRPAIFVGLVGGRDAVRSMLKRWRTTNVDVDSRGKPCLERMMNVLSEGYLQRSVSTKVDSESAQSEEELNQSLSALLELSNLIGCDSWSGAIRNSMRR